MFIYWHLFDRILFDYFVKQLLTQLVLQLIGFDTVLQGEIFYSNSFHFNIGFGFDTAYFFFITDSEPFQFTCS